MKPIRFAFSLLLILCHCIALGQQKLKRGYYIKSSGDTIKGFISYKNWKRSPESIEFRRHAQSQSEFIKPSEIIEFGLEQEKQTIIYRSQQANPTLSMLPNTQKNELNEAEKKQWVFMQLILEGKVTLYKHVRADNKMVLYIKKDNMPLTELVSRVNYPDNSNAEYSIKRSFIYQFATLLVDCPNITASDLERLRYHEEDIQKLLINYNSCGGSTAKGHTYKTDKLEIKIGLVAGVSHTNLVTGGLFEQPQYFSKSIDPTGGISAALVLPGTFKKSSIYAELLYRTYDVHSERIEKLSEFEGMQIQRRYNYVFSPTYLKSLIAYRYQMPNGLVKPFFTVGMTNSFVISKTVEESYSTRSYDLDNSSSFTILPDPRRYEQGLSLSLGIGLSSFLIELRGEITNGFSSHPRKRTSLNTGYLLIHYQF